MPENATDIRNAVLLSVATFAAGFLVPLAPYVGMPLGAYALGWIAFRFGWRWSTALAVAASVPMVILAPSLGFSRVDSVFVAVTLLAVGPGTAWALSQRSAWTVMAGVTMITAAAFFATPIGIQSLADTISVWSQAIRQAAASGSLSGVTDVSSTIAAFVAQVRLSWPFTVTYMMGLGALASVPLVSRAGRSLGVAVNRYPALADTDLTFHLVWPSIAGLGLIAAGTVWGGGRGLMYTIGFNLLMIVRPALVLQGLAVFASLYRRIGAGRVWRTIGYVLLVLTELAIPSVSIVGVADLFFNLRKLPRGGKGPVALQ